MSITATATLQWEHLATGFEDALIEATDGELLADPNAGERIDAVRALIRSATSATALKPKASTGLLPQSTVARRELLRLLLSRRHGNRTLSAAFKADDIPDSKVETTLRQMLDRKSDRN